MSRSSGIGRLQFAGIVLGLLFAWAAYAQLKVQTWGADDILRQARRSNRFVIARTDPALRGAIYSSDGKVLAHSDNQFELGVNFRKVPHSPAFLMALGTAADLPASELIQLAASGRGSAVWRRPLSLVQARAIQDVKSRWRADGVSLTRALQRDYALGEAASGVLGALRDGKPVSGLELSQDAVLAGRDGRTEGLIDRNGYFLPMRLAGSNRERKNGDSIVLTLDSNLQLAASTAIRQAVEANKADAGVVVIIEPKTGDLLAMANWPSFDPEGQRGSAGASAFNPNYMGAYEPGSTFKILTLAKALDAGAIQPDFTVNCTGARIIGTPAWRVRCAMHQGGRAHGLCDLERAIAKSCNVSAATWALKIGYQPMVRFIEELGLLRPTRLGVPLERGGMFDRDEHAKPLQLANVGFGQSLTATPVALAAAFAMLANHGVRAEPRLIKQIGTRELPISTRRVVSTEAADRVLELMESVIQSDVGTGRVLRLPGYRLAGKTGTAEKVNRRTGEVGGGGYVSSFVGVVPAHEPRAVVLVMVDNPKAGKYYGAAVAGPVFLSMAKTLVRYYSIPPGAPTGVVPAKPDAISAQAAAVAPGDAGKRIETR